MSELPDQFCMRGDGRVVRREPEHVIEPDIFEPTFEVRAAIELARLNGRVRELEQKLEVRKTGARQMRIKIENQRGQLSNQEETMARLKQQLGRTEERLECATGDRDAFKHGLNAMTEDRDEYQRAMHQADDDLSKARERVRELGESLVLANAGAAQMSGLAERATKASERSAKGLERAVKVAEDLQQQLKTMTEDRDEYRTKLLRNVEMQGSMGIDLDLAVAMTGATADEHAMALTYVQKLMGEGRTEHGALDLANDSRDLMGEGLDELDDVMSYLMMFKRRLELRKGER